MAFNQDFKELLAALNDHEVRFLIVGAYAVMFHTDPRYTKGIDVWSDCEESNAKRTYSALAQFGAPLHDLTVEDLATPGTNYQVGVEPNRVDILTAPSGVEFETAWNRRVPTSYEGVPAHVLSLEDVIQSKRASGRPQDLLDLERLELLE